MYCKSLLALTMVGTVALFLTGRATASPYQPGCASSGKCVETPTPNCKQPARPDKCGVSCPKVAARRTSPADLRCAAPAPRCETRAPVPCHEPVTHTLTIYNGTHVERQDFVLRHGSWESRGEIHR
jgi:hypothetical protein